MFSFEDKLLKNFESNRNNIELSGALREVPNKDKAEFDFSLNKLHLSVTGTNKQKIERLREYASEAMLDREKFFNILNQIDPIFESNEKLIINSPLETEDDFNNYVFVDKFLSKKNKRLLLILPFWNCKKGGLNSLGKTFSKIGISSACVTLPYHGYRMPLSMKYAEGMFSPNIGLTIRSIRQAVMDVRAVVRKFKKDGYERVDILGVSMGSMIAKIVSIIESDVNNLVACLGGSHIANFSIEGLATQHVQKKLNNKISYQELKDIWSIVSPVSHLSEGLLNPKLKQLCITAKYDKIVPENRALEYIRKSRENKIETDWISVPCGHYSFSNTFVSSYSFFKVFRFLKGL